MAWRKLALLVLGVIMLCSLAACGNKVDSKAVREYADEITEKMLLAYNEDNYEEYIANTNSQFKTVVSEDKMKEGNEMIRGKIGDYVPGSKKFKDAVKTSQKEQKYLVVRYNAKFTDESEDVLVTMIFDDNEAHQVGGIFFNSPKLREQSEK
ncbi:DUF3887 domain-containing protein [Syntrophomonas wolfei]|jgi:uncharacterized lipoprotein YehR (DUF1307 family)|uniref:DUF3887 domain-containing protein n=1 Tax=Syntrophomonas wolfei TaxID=863 RepID=A0A354YWY2_9FIRM|nr:DUF3887 domain-containing protein [Syntrophomonas wolfei]HBK53860.1 DUF3887 domain-containing protein [Syntrophomonas wolfei]